MADRPPLTITINGIAYPCSSWQTERAARTLERRYDVGFNGGMGHFAEELASAPNQIYHCVNLDPTTFPYIRMRKAERDGAITLSTGADADKPAYGFVVDGPASREYLYIVNATRSYKIDLGVSGNGTPAEETGGSNPTQPSNGSGDFASGVVGRPVLFEDAWYVPLGAGTNALKLTATAAGDQAGDTWADVGETALHFATMMNEGVAEIWRAHTTNLIDASADGATFAGDFEVGDSTFPITDMLNLSGELFISKPDAPYRFDSQGVSKAVMEFVGATGGNLTNSTSYDGSNSGVHGPYAYWCHSTGLWRIWGDSARPVDPFSQRNWSGISLDSLTPSYNTGWFSCAGWGQWLYAINASDGLYVGWVEEDGSVTWMGNLVSSAETSWSAKARMGITTTSLNPILWMLDDSRRFAVFDLELDGSIRAVRAAGISATDRGANGEKGQIWMPGTDLGEPEKQKQLRMGWLTIDNNAYTNLAVEMRFHRDRAATSTQMGSDLGSSSGDGQFEFVMTPGTTDTFYEGMLAVRFDTTDTSVAVTGTDISFFDGSGGADEIRQTAAGFGIFAAGDRITVSGASDNNGTYTIVSVIAATITLATATLPAAPEAAGDSVTITREFNTDKADPRIRSMGFRAVTPHTYKATVPVTPDGMVGSLGVKDALLALRALKSGEGVPVLEPGFNATFTGYVKDVQERIVSAQDGSIGYALEVTISRWVL